MKGYKGWEKDCEYDYNVFIVCNSSKEAKGISFRELRDYGSDCEYIDVRVKWIKEGNIEGLPFGVCDEAEELIRRNIFQRLPEGGRCDRCNQFDIPVEHYKGECLCIECIDRIREKE